MSEGQQLSMRQKAFAKAYVCNMGNGAAAARDANYSDSSEGAKVQASRLLTNPNVKAAIEEEVAKVLTATNLSRDDVKAMLLKEALRDENQDGARIRAQELLGKTFAMFIDRQVVDEQESIGARELVLKLAGETPTAAIGMAIDLCVADFEMVEALKPETPKVAARLENLLASGAKLLDVDLDLPAGAESDENAGESPEAGS